jgi:hypothetical protein
LRTVFLVVLSGLCSAPVMAQPETRPGTLRPARFEQAPIIDGHLDEAIWSQAARLSEFRQVQPGDDLEPSQTTEVLIGYDRRAL